LAVSLVANAGAAELINRGPSESDSQLMARVLGASADLAQDVVHSTDIAAGKMTVIGFVLGEDSTLIGHLLVEQSPGRFQHVEFPTACDEEGGAPKLEAVFFARTVKGGGRDLGILCSWEAQHAIVNGTLYAASFYRLAETGDRLAVEPVTNLNKDKRFTTSDLTHRDQRGKWVNGPKPTFTTVAGVKKLLKKMGIEQ